MVHEIKGPSGDRRQQDAIVGLLSARKHNGSEFKCMYPQVAGGFSRCLVVFGVQPVEIFEDKQIKRSTIETGRSEGGLSGSVDGQQKKVTRIWPNSAGEIE